MADAEAMLANRQADIDDRHDDVGIMRPVNDMRLAARLCWAIDRHAWAIAAANLAAAVVFVAGCVTFYSPALYVPGVTLFLVGSLLWLGAGAAEAYRRYGPAE